MAVPYELFIADFTQKITDRDLLYLDDVTRDDMVMGFLRRAIGHFKRVCKYDLISTRDDASSQFDVDIPEDEVDEIVDIVSEGMVVEWLKPYVNHQDLIQNILTTRDFNVYSPAELLKRVGDAYRTAKKDYKHKIADYTYDVGDLTTLHL